MYPTRRPSVFIVSAGERTDVVDIVKDALSPVAEVVRWTDPTVWVLGSYNLESLLAQIHRHDFAILIFAHDDKVDSRGTIYGAPRDNVIFEAGLFMSVLGRERTLVLAAKRKKKQLKFLSDLSGLVPAEFELREDKSDLQAALSVSLSRITAHIGNLGARREKEPTASPGPRDVIDVGAAVQAAIDAAKSSLAPVTVLNLGLDLGLTWPIIKTRLLEDEQAQNVCWRTLMIDPKSSFIRKLTSKTVSVKTAAEQIEHIREHGADLEQDLRQRNVNFQCRAYSHPPLVHGFLLNQQSLLYSVCDIRGGKLVGSPNPYWRFEKNANHRPTSHLFDAFTNWFEHHWSTAAKVWPS